MDTHEVTGTVKERAGKAERVYGELKDNAQDAFDQATSCAKDYSDESIKTIQRYPATSLAIAIAAGFALGMVLTNRD